MGPRGGFRGRRGPGRMRKGHSDARRRPAAKARLESFSEPDQSEVVEPVPGQDDELEPEEELDLPSSDEEPDASNDQLPYSTLLQALSASGRRSEPPHKKRKLYTSTNLNGPDQSAPSNGFSVNKISTEQSSEAVELDDVEEDLVAVGEDEADDVSDEDQQRDDPFEEHLSGSCLDDLSSAIQSNKGLLWRKQPGMIAGGWKYVSAVPDLPDVEQGIIPSTWTKISDLCLKQKLQKAPKSALPTPRDSIAPLAGPIFGYKDVLCTNRTVENASELRKLYCTHALNHTLKTRDKVIKNNGRLAKIDDDGDDRDDDKYRDQGFTRPRVLFLLPTRQACSKVVDTMMEVLQAEQQENRKRFKESFAEVDDLAASDKPADFKELFAGNDDDRFLLGLKLTRKTVKFFSSFYNSDIVFASPLGLHAKITAEDKKKRDWDFLSSIEVLIVDQADALIMQNWENVETVFEHLNLEPKQSHGCDFARVRRWYLEKCARYFRQTLVFSAYNAPELNALFEHSMSNVSGKIKIGREQYDGAIMRLGLQVKQIFARFDTLSPSADPEARFKYFTTSLLPILAKYAKAGAGKLQGTLIFIPSYMDFLRVQNFFCYSNDTQGIVFDEFDLPCISEYASKQQNARARSLFQSGKHSILLYTGRAHHFYRYKLRGVRRVIMYSLPENPAFYEELVGQTLSRSVSVGKFSPDEISAQSMFSKYDALKLERVIGTQRFATMLKAKGDIFEFF